VGHSQRDRSILVTGGGGFIGGHLVKRLVATGARVRAVDIKPVSDWHQAQPEAENVVTDLRREGSLPDLMAGFDDVFHLAADMGGIGYITSRKWDCMLSAVLDGVVLRSAVDAGVERFLYTSSACVYRLGKQGRHARPLREADAYPADPEDGYGWAKLFTERLCEHAEAETPISTRVARLHNVFGPHGKFRGGREKAPAALCRKVAEFQLERAEGIEIWGSGEQERSFLYVDDAVEALILLIESEVSSPLNVGSEEKVTIAELADLIEEIAGTRAPRHFQPDAPTGVESRVSDNARIREELDWQPEVDLRSGLQRLYPWVLEELR
jgi:GDP-D-mannose 3',5'-epimerase